MSEPNSPRRSFADIVAEQRRLKAEQNNADQATQATQPGGGFFDERPEDVPNLDGGASPVYDDSFANWLKGLPAHEAIQRITTKQPFPRSTKPGWHGSNLFRCPWPAHEDKHPSAQFKGPADGWHCHGCAAGGGDWLDLAAAARGLTSPGQQCKDLPDEQFHNFVEQLKTEFGWVDPPSRSGVVVVDDSPNTADTEQLVTQDQSAREQSVNNDSGTTSDSVSDEDADENILVPSYSIARVLPQAGTFLDEYCAQTLALHFPQEWPLFAGLMVLSTAIGSRFSLKVTSSPTYANLAICLVGPSTSGKGATQRPAISLLNRVVPYDDTPMSGGLPPEGTRHVRLPGSAEALIRDIEIPRPIATPTKPNEKVPAIRGFSLPTIVEWEELQMLVVKSAAASSSYKSFIIEFADRLDLISTNSVSGGGVYLKRPYVNFFTGTQPAHLRDQFTKKDQHSGLINRFIFAFGTPVPWEWENPHQPIWLSAESALKKTIQWARGLPDKGDIAGEYCIDRSDWDTDAWQRWVSFASTTIEQDRTGPYTDLLGRMGQQMLRFILLFAINDMSTQIKLEHVEAALELYQYIRGGYLALSSEMAKTEISEGMTEVLRLVEHLETSLKKPPTKRDIDKLMARKKLNDQQFGEIIEKLRRAGMIEYCTTKSRTGRGRPGRAYTTSLAQWDATAQVEVKKGH